MCSNGNIPAQDTAKSVIASANRLMEVRHFCRSNNKIAEISVPAWPIPIHHTKFTMANPHPTGILIPQMSVPTQEQVAHRVSQQHQQREGDRKSEVPPSRRVPPQYNRADFVGYRGVSVPWFDSTGGFCADSIDTG